MGRYRKRVNSKYQMFAQTQNSKLETAADISSNIKRDEDADSVSSRNLENGTADRYISLLRNKSNSELLKQLLCKSMMKICVPSTSHKSSSNECVWSNENNNEFKQGRQRTDLCSPTKVSDEVHEEENQSLTESVRNSISCSRVNPSSETLVASLDMNSYRSSSHTESLAKLHYDLSEAVSLVDRKRDLDRAVNTKKSSYKQVKIRLIWEANNIQSIMLYLSRGYMKTVFLVVCQIAERQRGIPHVVYVLSMFVREKQELVHQKQKKISVQLPTISLEQNEDSKTNSQCIQTKYCLTEATAELNLLETGISCHARIEHDMMGSQSMKSEQMGARINNCGGLGTEPIIRNPQVHREERNSTHSSIPVQTVSVIFEENDLKDDLGTIISSTISKHEVLEDGNFDSQCLVTLKDNDTKGIHRSDPAYAYQQRKIGKLRHYDADSASLAIMKCNSFVKDGITYESRLSDKLMLKLRSKNLGTTLICNSLSATDRKMRSLLQSRLLCSISRRIGTSAYYPNIFNANLGVPMMVIIDYSSVQLKHGTNKSTLMLCSQTKNIKTHVNKNSHEKNVISRSSVDEQALPSLKYQLEKSSGDYNANAPIKALNRNSLVKSKSLVRLECFLKRFALQHYLHILIRSARVRCLLTERVKEQSYTRLTHQTQSKVDNDTEDLNWNQSILNSNKTYEIINCSPRINANKEFYLTNTVLKTVKLDFVADIIGKHTMAPFVILYLALSVYALATKISSRTFQIVGNLGIPNQNTTVELELCGDCLSLTRASEAQPKKIGFGFYNLPYWTLLVLRVFTEIVRIILAGTLAVTSGKPNLSADTKNITQFENYECDFAPTKRLESHFDYTKTSPKLMLPTSGSELCFNELSAEDLIVGYQYDTSYKLEDSKKYDQYEFTRNAETTTDTCCSVDSLECFSPSVSENATALSQIEYFGEAKPSVILALILTHANIVLAVDFGEVLRTIWIRIIRVWYYLMRLTQLCHDKLSYFAQLSLIYADILHHRMKKTILRGFDKLVLRSRVTSILTSSRNSCQAIKYWISLCFLYGLYYVSNSILSLKVRLIELYFKICSQISVTRKLKTILRSKIKRSQTNKSEACMCLDSIERRRPDEYLNWAERYSHLFFGVVTGTLRSMYQAMKYICGVNYRLVYKFRINNLNVYLSRPSFSKIKSYVKPSANAIEFEALALCLAVILYLAVYRWSVLFEKANALVTPEQETLVRRALALTVNPKRSLAFMKTFSSERWFVYQPIIGSELW